MKNLKGTGVFTNVNISNTSRQGVSGIDIYNFLITCSYTGHMTVSKDQTGIQGGSEGDEYVYESEGRRDPFWNLLLSKSVKVKREQYVGIAGMLIEELELEAIMRLGKGPAKALVKGPDGKPYVIKVGDFLYDGEVIKMDNHSVTFKKNLQFTVKGRKDQIIVKTTNPGKKTGEDK